MNSKAIHVKSTLKESVSIPEENRKIFFKTGIGHYAEHDQFIGVPVPFLRKTAKHFSDLSLEELQILIESKINEERMVALFILISQYEKAKDPMKEKLYKFYMSNLKHVNNWNLVDASAHLIIGAHLYYRRVQFNTLSKICQFNEDETLLYDLAKSEVMWLRRISIVATWYFIRKKELKSTFIIAEILIKDSHDLIHKAVGWMLREAGKRDEKQLIAFLDKHYSEMPRTMLRYAIEKFPESKRKKYLMKKKSHIIA